MYYSVKNFERYQHYKDRNPPWIKLHRSLLHDYNFVILPDSSKAHLILIWIVASQTENKLPANESVLQHMIGATEPLHLNVLVNAGFLVPWNQRRKPSTTWASRYISPQMRSDVLMRDQHRCIDCGSQDRLEIDHIIPISKGGIGEMRNLATRCKSCNRRKRTRSTLAEHNATHELGSSVGSVTSETEKRRDRVEREKKPLKSPLPDTDWLKALQTDPAYAGLDVPTSIAKCRVWCETNKQTFSKRRIVNWLNRQERPLTTTTTPQPRALKPLPALPVETPDPHVLEQIKAYNPQKT